MTYLLLLGLYSWIAMGLLVGLLAPNVLGGAGGRRATMIFGVLGAITGGLLATFLGFGGLAGFDIRSLVTATLASLLAVMLRRLRQVPA